MTRIKNVFSVDATTTTLTQKVQENGLCRVLVITTANFTNNVTTTVTILDTDDNVLWTKNAIARNTTTRIDDTTTPIFGSVPMDYNYQIKVELSGAAGGTGGDVKVFGFVIGDR